VKTSTDIAFLAFDTDRNDPICVMLPKVAKANKASIFMHKTANSFANKLRQCL
jgi:hypothetical protein